MKILIKRCDDILIEKFYKKSDRKSLDLDPFKVGVEIDREKSLAKAKILKSLVEIIRKVRSKKIKISIEKFVYQEKLHHNLKSRDREKF